MFGRFHDARRAFAAARSQVHARTLLVLILTGMVALGVVYTAASPAGAIPINVIDDAGPDDEPGQKDLNELTVDFAPAGDADLTVAWRWDVVSVSGANTGDACALFDTDDDGNVDYSLCVVWGSDGEYETTRLYACGDGAADRCTQPRTLLAEDMNGDGDIADAGENLVNGPYASTCSVMVLDEDTFGERSGAQASDTQDTQATCEVQLDDFGGADSAFLTNVCSYPSQVPGSDPSDCVLGPNSGFLTLVKAADPDDGTTFTFELGAGQAANDGDTSFSIDGSGSISLIGFAADTGYDLTEVVPSGWQLDSVSCVLSDGTSTGTALGDGVVEFEIQIGRETTCTFTDSKPGTLTLVKEVNNDNGGTASESDWTLTADGPSGFFGPSGVSQPVSAGTYDLTESGPAGYTASGWVCSAGQIDADSVAVANGDDITCTITNDDVAPSLTLVKVVTNDNGGGAVASDWDLSAGPTGFSGTTGVTSDASFDAGTYALSELGSAGTVGYVNTSITCDDDPGVEVTEVTLGLGETITCTFVNDDVSPSLTVIKTVVNDNGGTAVPDDFGLTVDGGSVLSGVTNAFDAGAHTVAEVNLAGYAAGVWGGDCAADGSITLVLAQDATCTITNDDVAPSLTLVKVVTNDNGGTADAGDWTLTAAGPTGFSGTTGVTSDSGFVAGEYDLSESGPAGYVASDWVCVGGTQSDGDTVAVGLGESATCTITNDDIAPSLTLVKTIVNDDGGTVTDPDAFGLRIDGVLVGDSVANVVDAGPHSVSEDGLAGYAAGVWGGDCAADGSITLALAQDATCTITNDDVSPSLTVIKTVVNDNGGTAVPDDFGLTVDGGSVLSGVTNAFDAGAHTVAEVNLAGYAAGVWGGDCAADGSITLVLAQDATCTITNDDLPPSLVLKKIVVNDNGGGAVASDWDLSAGPNTVEGSAAGVVATDQTGTYALSELGSAGTVGYVNTSITCDDDPGVEVTEVTLGLGETITCTFVNDDVSPSLTVIKTVVNDNGGTAVPDDFGLTVDGGSVLSGVTNAFDAGAHTVAEVNLAGYAAGVWGGDCAADGSITLVLAQDATCTITNDDVAPSLTLVKVVTNDNGGTADAGDWTLTAAGPTGFSGTTGVTSDSGFVAGEYDLSESGPAGYVASDWVCVGGTQSDGDTVAVGLGESATCTITNDDIAASLTLIKVVENGANPGGSAVASDWTLTAAGPTGFSGATGVTSDSGFVAGEYDLSESGPAGYVASDWVCVGGTQSDGDTVTVGSGESATCTITNTAVGRAQVNKTTNGVAASGFTFEIRQGATITEEGVVLAAGTTDDLGFLDFGGLELNPGEMYQLCETGMLPGWSNTLDGFTPAGATSEGGDNSAECVDFVPGVGETVVFNVDNIPPPGGDARTIGFWKNWTSCDGRGNQDPILDETLAAAGGTIKIGELDVSSCEVAVALLDKRDIDTGRKLAGNPAYGLAAQLLAAKLNLVAGAASCPELAEAIADADALLGDINFLGTGNSYLRQRSQRELRQPARDLAATLDAYNNNELCG